MAFLSITRIFYYFMDIIEDKGVMGKGGGK